MKRLLAAVAMTLTIAGLAAQTATIEMKNGKVHENVQVLNVNPIGVDIAYKGAAGHVVKNVPFKDVSEKTREEFGYSKAKAKEFERKRRAMIKRHRQIREEINRRGKAGEPHSPHKHPSKPLDKEQIERSGIKVLLKVVAARSGGVVAWADTPDATVTTGHLGKVFVRGLDVPSGGAWNGTIYPTGQTVDNHPCYTPSMYMAIGYNKTNK